MENLRVGFSNINKPKEGFSSDSESELFLRTPLEKNTESKYKFRLVGEPVGFYTTYFQPDGGKRKRYIVPASYVQRIKDLKLAIRELYAITIFDRADTKEGITRLKILEKPASVFNYFREYAEEFEDDDGNKIHPGGPQGPDWTMKIKVPDDKMRTEYTCIALACKPFSKEEQELLNRDPNAEENKKLPITERGPIDLQKFYNFEKEAKKIEEDILSKNILSEADSEPVDEDPDDAKVDEDAVSSDEVSDIFG